MPCHGCSICEPTDAELREERKMGLVIDHNKCAAGVTGCTRTDFHIHQEHVMASTPPEQKQEAVNHPNHYGGDTTYETVKVLAAWGLGFLLGNAIKYISRAGKKDPAKLVEDLEKARWYLDHAITRLKAKQEIF